MKIALGFDTHKLISDKNGSIVLAGVKIPSSCSIVAHSDGDVVYHALIDAIAGVFLKKSIGEIFNEKDSKNKDRDSNEFLKIVFDMANKPKMINCDINIILEKPLINSYCDKMRENIANLLDCDKEKISIRGKRREDNIKKISCISSILFE